LIWKIKYTGCNKSNIIAKRGMFMSEEHKILSATEEAKVALYPKYGLGASILKGVTGFFFRVVPRYFTHKTIDNWSKSSF
jgi:hypothetical protein